MISDLDLNFIHTETLVANARGQGSRQANPGRSAHCSCLTHGEAFNRHYERIKDALPSSVRSKPNSKCSTKTILEYLLMMCSEGASHEGIFQRWQDKIDRKSVLTGPVAFGPAPGNQP